MYALAYSNDVCSAEIYRYIDSNRGRRKRKLISGSSNNGVSQTISYNSVFLFKFGNKGIPLLLPKISPSTASGA